MINIYQGETLKVQVNVVDNNGDSIDLVGASAELSYKGLSNDVVTTKSCTINGSVIDLELSSTETSTMLGSYQYEVKLTDNVDDVDIIVVDRIEVIKSINP